MLNCSEEFRQAIAASRMDYRVTASIVFADNSSLEIPYTRVWMGGFDTDDAVSPENIFHIGGGIVNKATLVLNNLDDYYTEYDFDGATIVVRVGLEIDGTVESLKKFTGDIANAAFGSGLLTLTIHDRMGRFDKPYDSSLDWSTGHTLLEIVRDACTRCNVPTTISSFPNMSFVVNEKPNGDSVTYREVIMWAAQIGACYAKCDVDGKLILAQYERDILAIKLRELENVDIDPAVDYGIPVITSLYSHELSLNDVVITGIKFTYENTDIDGASATITYTRGTDGYVVDISGNLLVDSSTAQNVVNYLGNQLIGFTFRKASLRHICDPTLEGGDVAILVCKGKKYPIIVSGTRFSVAGSQNTESSAEEPARNLASRISPTTKNFVKAKEMVTQEKSARQTAYNELAGTIAAHSGLYQTVEQAPGGGSIYYLHDKPTKAASNIIWKMTADAVGVSTDGGTTWSAGLTADGAAILNRLSAVSIDVDDLTVTGTLHDAANKNSWNLATGAFAMTDGTIILDGESLIGTAIRSILNENGLSVGELVAGALFPKMRYQDFIRGEYDSSDHDDYLLEIDPSGAIRLLGTPGTSQGYPMAFMSGHALRLARSGSSDTFYADNDTGITTIKELMLNGISSDIATFLSPQTASFENTTYGITVSLVKRCGIVDCYIHTTSSGLLVDLPTASAYVNLGTLPTGFRPAQGFVNVTEIGTRYRGQVNPFTAGGLQIGYTREFNASSNSNVPAGTTVYSHLVYVAA